MAWALLLLTALHFFSGAISQPTLTQPASQSVSLGQTVKITCTISSNPNTVGWHQQRSGQGPRYVHADGGFNRGEGIPDRFTASRSGSTGYLTITNTQAEDEAVYFCAMWHSSGSSLVFGEGTQLTVTGVPSVRPKVSVYPPSDDEMTTKQKATSVCLMSDFNPGSVQVEWLCDGKRITSGVETSRPTKQGQNYVASSYLTQTPQEWQRHSRCSCKVTHDGQVIEKTVTRS